MQQNNGLDKNQLISFGIFSMILIGFMFYFQNRNAQAEQEKLALEAKKTEQTAKSKLEGKVRINLIENTTKKVFYEEVVEKMREDI